jgi:peptidoglycan/LPS O-acetylase OafA/YrhL
MRSTSRTTFPTVTLTAVADALLILVFAAIGRDAHARGDIITGVFATAWPFLAGAALAWLAARVWRAPLALWPSGVAVWIGALAGGMLLRAVTGQSVVLPFVIVALISLAVFLLGYRAIIAFAGRLRGSRRRT